VTTVVVDYPNPDQEDVEFRQAKGEMGEQAEIAELLRAEVEELLKGAMVARIPETMTPEQKQALLEAGAAFVMPLAEEVKGREPGVLAGVFLCNYHVKTVASLTLEQADRLLFVSKHEMIERACDYEDCDDESDHAHEAVGEIEDVNCTWWEYAPRSLTIDLSYPLGVGSRVTVHPYTMKFSREGESKRVYTEHERYKVWGHAMDDLYFEGFVISEDGEVRLRMGS
jgi:hypothetical protein